MSPRPTAAALTERREQPTDHDLDAIVERVTAELAHRYDPGAIKDCVKRCDAELDAATSESRPELVERLARQRLSNHEQS